LIRGGFQRNSAPAPAPAQGQQPDAAAGVRVGWQTAISTTVEGLGYELVDVERAPRGLLRITIDRVPGRVYGARGGLAAAGASGDGSESVTVEDCEKVTRQLQYALEVEGLDYARLEVSSPGLDRPLKRPADYERFAGQAIQLVLKQPFQGRKNWQGVLTAEPFTPGPVAAVAAAAGPAASGSTAVEADGSTLPARWSLVFKDGKAEQVLSFTLEEVREARLVPVVNFKGRKAPDGGGEQVHAASPKNDGG
jgi:ribosome maturation factor RimP